MLRTVLSFLFFYSTAAFDPPAVFPASTRQALLQKSKNLLDGSSSSSGTYTTAGWSNRAASVLTPACPEGVYTADRPFLWNSIDVGCRSTIIELPSSSQLWVHSPVGLDGPMQAAVEKLGQVQHIVSPNYEHVKFAPVWHQAYPDARCWACPGLAERLPDIQFAGEIPEHYRPVSWTAGERSASDVAFDASPQTWDTSVIEALHLDIEANPFTGKPFFNEVIYYHVPSKTLMMTDLFWNYPSADGVPNSQYGHDDSWELAPVVEVPWKSSLWKFGMDRVYYPFFNNFMIQDREAYKQICHHILNVWDVETVIPAHGDILRGKEFIGSVLRKYFQV